MIPAPLLMQLDLRLGAVGETARKDAENDAAAAVQRIFVHLVKRAVHQLREPDLRRGSSAR